jgi:hypothetical protein
MADSRTIGEKLQAIDEHARQGGIPENKAGNKEPAEGSRETVIGSEQKPEQQAPRRGER